MSHVLTFTLVMVLTVFVTHLVQADEADEPFDESKEAWPKINYKMHIFYYPWYKSQPFDGKWFHWNESPSPKWTPGDKKNKYIPPDDISSNFYPKLGAYSSNDSKVIDQHMRWIRATGIGVVAVSWYPPMYAPSKLANVDKITPQIFDIANKYKLKVTFLVERYNPDYNITGKKYDGETLKEVVKYIVDTYGKHPAFYRTPHNGKRLPMYYWYRANEPQAVRWQSALQPGGEFTVRGTEYDGIFAMLFMYPKHFGLAYFGGWDALFTYFSIKDLVYASTWAKWREIQQIAKSLNMIFIPSFGPGYNDTRLRPFNAHKISGHDGGAYYEQAFQAALYSKAKFMSITAFNEWHEGSIIEPCVPKTINNTYDPALNKTHTVYHYNDMTPHEPTRYLQITKKIVKEFTESKIKPSIVE